MRRPRGSLVRRLESIRLRSNSLNHRGARTVASDRSGYAVSPDAELVRSRYQLGVTDQLLLCIG